MSSQQRGKGPRSWGAFPPWAWGLALVAVFAAGVLVGRSGWLEGPGRRPGADGEEAAAAPPASGARVRPPGREEPGSPSPPPPPAAQPATAPVPAGNLALVIDDLGRSVEVLDTLAALGVPLSYAVLPYEERTAEVVARLRGDKREILCHLPMQPGNGSDPGPGALYAGMDPAALASATRRALARVPGAVGVNNHMGSSLTADPRSMEPILEVLQQEGLFFLDSRTSADSVGYQLARSLGLPSAERDVFLDADTDPQAIREQFQRLLDVARAEGAAIAIAHPLPGTLAVLQEEVRRARAEGFTFVPVSFLLDRSGDPL